MPRLERSFLEAFGRFTRGLEEAADVACGAESVWANIQGGLALATPPAKNRAALNAFLSPRLQESPELRRQLTKKPRGLAAGSNLRLNSGA